MDIMVVINQMIQLFLIIGLGYFMQKKNILNDELNSKLNYIVISITTPAMIFSSVCSTTINDKSMVIYTLGVATAVYLLLPVIFFFGFLFTVGVSFILSTVSVFFRDMFYIYGIILTIWNYATPVFYDISIIPATLQTIFKFNPLYSYINSAREIILFGRCPATMDLVFVVVYGILAVIIGAIVFKRHQDKFIYYA